MLSTHCASNRKSRVHHETGDFRNLWRQLVFVKIVCNASIRTIAESRGPRNNGRMSISKNNKRCRILCSCARTSAISRATTAACPVSKISNAFEYFVHVRVVDKEHRNSFFTDLPIKNRTHPLATGAAACPSSEYETPAISPPCGCAAGESR